MKHKVLVSRPGLAGEGLVKALTELGLNARHGPTLAIEARPFSAPENLYDSVIFISPSAVEASLLAEPNVESLGKQVIAVGSGTAQLLTDHGIHGVRIPETFNSEGLLAMSELNHVTGSRILVVKGKGGRPLLKDTLVQRGARVDSLDVYERLPISIDQETWGWFWQDQACRHLTCASIETLESFDNQRLANNLPPDVTIYVASDRIAEAGRRLGYTNVHNVGGAANNFFVANLKKLTDV